MNEQQKQTENQVTSAIGFPCPQCGAQSVYDPKLDALFCSYCQTTQKIESKVIEAPEYLFFPDEDRFDAPAWEDVGNRHMVCSSCGADISVSAATVTTSCPFCGGTYVTESEADESLIRPETMIPFRISEDEAKSLYSRWAKKKMFAPSAYRRASQKTPDVKGVYIPHFTFDCDLSTSYTGQGGHDRTVVYTVRVNGKTETRTRIVTDWYPIVGAEQLYFDDYAFCASKKIDRELLEKVGPFNMKMLNVYNPAYLAGFFAERYDRGLSEGFASIKPKFERDMEYHIQRVRGFDHYRFMSYTHLYNSVRFKHILLPVFMSAFSYKNKSYPFFVNGESSRVAGKSPVSPLKVALAVALGLGISALLIFLMQIAR